MLILPMIAAIVLVAFLFWIVRGTSGATKPGSSPRLHRVDTLAFRNLLSRNDEAYLRTSLSRTRYRLVRRARLRALQEYLLWIAADCAALLAWIRASQHQPSRGAETVARKAITLRLTALVFWALLWIELVVPGIEFKPGAALEHYEEFWRSAEVYLTNNRSQPAWSSGQG
jgi:hypothetical protein